jgi:hypothetical protein
MENIMILSSRKNFITLMTRAIFTTRMMRNILNGCKMLKPVAASKSVICDSVEAPVSTMENTTTNTSMTFQLQSLDWKNA